MGNGCGRRTLIHARQCIFLVSMTYIIQLLLGAALAAPLPASGTVVDVFDGDTILLNTGERVRYLGIDAPEISHEKAPSDCYAEESKRANAELLLHKHVKLSYDLDARDSHGRLLAYVELPDGRCVNAEMIRLGYAWVFRSTLGFQRFDSFLALQQRAIEKRCGIWGNCTVKKDLEYIGNSHSYIFHRPMCSLGQQTSPRNRTRFGTRIDALMKGYSPCRRCKP